MRKKSKHVGIAFLVIYLLFTAGSFSQVLLEGITVWDWLLGLLVSGSFLLAAYLVVDSYFMTRRALFLAFFVAVFFWPLISAGLSFYLQQDMYPGKFGYKFRMGGFGDFVSVQGLLDLLTDETPLVRTSLFLMLGTNLSFLVPFAMMHRSARTSIESGRESEEQENSGDSIPNSPAPAD